MTDIKKQILEQIEQIKADLPQPRALTDEEKLVLIKAIGGPRTVNSILKAKKDFAIARIPFLFNSLDTQLVIDVLANDWQEALDKYKK